MDRLVRQILPETSNSEGNVVRRLSDYMDKANIVLLGDPGAGKTHCFRYLASSESGRYITARSFLTRATTHSSESLFIDGLDERRAGRSDRDTVDALAQKLIDANPLAVRISCRVADWLGDSDLVSLDPFFETRGEVYVLSLGPLEPHERREALLEDGMTLPDAEAFLREAEQRGLSEFLGNPQNLLMLRMAVRSGMWPTSRRELFENATRLMLTETNEEYTRTASGSYSAEELRMPAGSAMAARLISDIEGISIKDREGTDTIPSYRNLPFYDSAKMIAALGRRVFVAGPVVESVEYAHRTAAEYLGAEWLAQQVRSGLPIGRVLALIGVDGHPAPELRGIHAWLPTHLPEYADQLIDADPYGVLLYGDVASFGRNHCKTLVQALGRLSLQDPWFRSGNRQRSVVAALARHDMVEEFRTVLRSEGAGFGLRSIIMEALAEGTVLPALCDDIALVFERASRPFAERVEALAALVRYGDEGIVHVLRAFENTLGADRSALRLRTEVIKQFYGVPLGPREVIHLLEDILASGDDLGTGILWSLPDHLPISDIPSILNMIPERSKGVSSERHSVWEVASFLDRTLLRALKECTELDPLDLLAWLRKRHTFAANYTGSHRDHVRDALQTRPRDVDAILHSFLDAVEADDMRWLHLNRFREATLRVISADNMIASMLEAISREPEGSPREVFFYQAALGLSFETGVPQSRFDHLFALADGRPDLQEARAFWLSSSIPTEHLEAKTSRNSQRSENEERSSKLARDFARDADAIRSGAHLGALTWAAMVYLGLFNDVDHSVEPQERFDLLVGEMYAATALDGLVASLGRADVPSLQEVVDLAAKREHFDWWFACIAGLCEHYRRTSSLPAISDELLAALLAFDLSSPVPNENESGWVQHSWKVELLHERPELVRDAYEALAKVCLSRGSQHAEGLRELLTDDIFAKLRSQTVLTLLEQAPNCHPHPLSQLLSAALTTLGSRQALARLCHQTLDSPDALGDRQRSLWLAAAWLSDPSFANPRLDAESLNSQDFVFDLRDLAGLNSDDDLSRTPLGLERLGNLIRLAGSLFPPVGYPSAGWGGDRNAWDGADFVRKLITVLSANPSRAAGEVLLRLRDDPTLVVHRGELLHAAALQSARRRETEYERPDWSRAIRALENRQPATVADLHAVFADNLDEVRRRIPSENTDIFRMFWNLDSYGRLLDPRPEEACRDDLITLLRPRLSPLGIIVEPEGHMAADRRADISVAMPGRKVLCEIKRNYHADVWTASENQLERCYAHDPDAQGFGVFLVFWFGTITGKEMPLAPNGAARPATASAMEAMLWAQIPVERRPRTFVIVVDVTKPN